MPRIKFVQNFIEQAQITDTESDLFRLIENATLEMGFRHFALIIYGDFRDTCQEVIRLNNYPALWTEEFVKGNLYTHDPILCASIKTSVGFVWSDVSSLIRLSPKQKDILENAAKHGLCNGFTVPANIPGESCGSCSFVTQRNEKISPSTYLVAQLIGAFSFQAARRLRRISIERLQRPPRLSPRQIECLVWAIKGKTDWEISRILGLNEETVTQHLNMARARYGVTKRLQLAVHAIYDGQISFIEALF